MTARRLPRILPWVTLAVLAAGVLLGPATAGAQQTEEPPPPEVEPGADGQEPPVELEAPDLGDIDAILEGEEEMMEGGGYVYDPGERRDPFKSLLASRDRPDLRGPRPEGVPGMLIDELRLSGIFHTDAGWRAQVQSGNKQKSYLLKEGDQLYDGDVVAISQNEVVFRQIVQDPTALKPFREVVKKLNP
jgi:hypothetical protein